jgi:hypothetical protein
MVKHGACMACAACSAPTGCGQCGLGQEGASDCTQMCSGSYCPPARGRWSGLAGLP